MLRRLTTAFALTLLLTPLGCFTLPPRERKASEPPPKDYDRPLPDGQHALRKITDPAELPDLAQGLAYRTEVLAACQRSLSYLAKPSSREHFPVAGIEHGRVVASLEAFRDLLASPEPDAEVAAEVRRRFDVYTTVGCDDRGTVLFTGYYTPVFQASRERTDRFRHPLHRLPPDHVKAPLTGETLGRRRPDGSVDPEYPTRRELLASGELEGLELVWLADPFEAYVVGVQGSAALELPDGSRMGVGYAGTNGRPYASVGRALVEAGELRPEELNLHRLIAYFRAHPEDFEPLTATNERYVFFQEGDGTPRGCLNEPVTAMASIATDKSIFPRAALCFLAAELPGARAAGPDGVYRGFVLDQDAGGAIRAPGRCDVYMGIGDLAGELAGRTLSEGRLYYLFLKDAAPK